MWYLCHSFALALHFIVKGLWWNKLVSLEFQNSLFFLTPLSNSIPFRVILCFPLPYLSLFFFLQLPLKQWRRNHFTLSLRFLVKKKCKLLRNWFDDAFKKMTRNFNSREWQSGMNDQWGFSVQDGNVLPTLKVVEFFSALTQEGIDDFTCAWRKFEKQKQRIYIEKENPNLMVGVGAMILINCYNLKSGSSDVILLEQNEYESGEEEGKRFNYCRREFVNERYWLKC